MINIISLSEVICTLNIKLNVPYTYDNIYRIFREKIHSMSIYILIHNNDIIYTNIDNNLYRFKYPYTFTNSTINIIYPNYTNYNIRGCLDLIHRTSLIRQHMAICEDNFLMAYYISIDRNRYISYISDTLKKDYDFLFHIFHIIFYNNSFLLPTLSLSQCTILNNLFYNYFFNTETQVIYYLNKKLNIYPCISYDLKQKINIILLALEYYNIYPYLPYKYKIDIQIIKLVCSKYKMAFNINNVPLEITLNRDLLLLIISNYPKTLYYNNFNIFVRNINNYYKEQEPILNNYHFNDDEEIMFKIIIILPACLIYASPRLQSKEDFLLSICNENIHAIQYIKHNAYHIFEKYMNQSTIKQNITKSLYNNIQSFNEYNNIDSLLLAVQHDWRIYCSLSNTIRANKSLIFMACKQNIHAFIHIPIKLLYDKELMIDLIKINGNILKYMTATFKKDKDIGLHAVQSNGLLISLLSSKLQSDIDIVNAAINNNGLSLQYVHKKYKVNKELVLKAASNNINALQFSLVSFINSEDVILKLHINSRQVTYYIKCKYIIRLIYLHFIHFILYIIMRIVKNNKIILLKK